MVLIGEAGRGDELRLVLSELLNRQDVTPEYEQRERFRTSALLTENQGDSSVWVFVTQSGPHVARLYFRGPYGNRFLLRQLSLRNGLDELGRELIAQVVETSTVALLRSEAGLTREEATRDISLQGVPLEGEGEGGVRAGSGTNDAPLAPAPTHAPARRDDGVRGERRLAYELSARGVAKWTGSDLGLEGAIGLETGLAWSPSRALFVRGRLVFEYGLGQSIETTAVNADVRTTALRAGVDVGTRAGPQALVGGLSGGVDLTKISPKSSSDSFALSGESTSTAPVIRLDARYELTLGVLRATAGVFGDVSLVDTHYDVRNGDAQTRIAEPWSIRPGFSLTVGWAPTL